jgi:ferredoxin
MNFAKRGFDTVISFYGVHNEIEPGCKECRTCVAVCPVGAILFKTPTKAGLQPHPTGD